MSFVAAVEYEASLDPTTFTVRDISIYTSPDDKANMASRTLTILQSDGSALPNYPNPINFPVFGPDFLVFIGLTQDLALQIILTLVPIVSHGGSVYVGETDVATQRFLQQGLFNIQVQQLNIINPSSLAAQQYLANSMNLIIEGQNAQTAVLFANFVGAQLALNRAQNIILNTTL